MIQTPSLTLVPFNDAHYQAIMASDYAKLGRLLNVESPEDWTESRDAVDAFPQFYQWFKELPDKTWGSYFILHSSERRQIGICGFKGGPGTDGFVEIGYEIKKAWQGRGYATEAAKALVELSFKKPKIKGVRAHTLMEENASTGVLKKCGFSFVGKVIDPQDGEVWRWEVPGS